MEWNLFTTEAANHTTQISQKFLTEVILYDRPIHNFREDSDKLIALFRDNNDWKHQSEFSIGDPIYRIDYKISCISFLDMFHK